jgi:acyl carrier protein|tara:strand:+ start:480 stop:722 length:243 start_codon:yes stop_codon:yes gene_type:complete
MPNDKQAEILQYVRQLKPANAGVDIDTDLISTGILNSLSVMELIAFLSQNFSISIPATDVTPDKLKSVTTLVALVEARSA